MLRFRIGVDVGGTFTDLILYDPKNMESHIAKVPTTDNPENAILEAPDFFSLCSGEQDERLKPVYDRWDRNLFSEKSYKDYVSRVFKTDFKLPEMTQEQLKQMEREEQADIEFDNQVFIEKCPTCPKQCDWYFDEKKKQKM